MAGSSGVRVLRLAFGGRRVAARHARDGVTGSPVDSLLGTHRGSARADAQLPWPATDSTRSAFEEAVALTRPPMQRYVSSSAGSPRPTGSGASIEAAKIRGRVAVPAAAGSLLDEIFGTPTPQPVQSSPSAAPSSPQPVPAPVPAGPATYVGVTWIEHDDLVAPPFEAVVPPR